MTKTVNIADTTYKTLIGLCTKKKRPIGEMVTFLLNRALALKINGKPTSFISHSRNSLYGYCGKCGYKLPIQDFEDFCPSCGIAFE